MRTTVAWVVGSVLLAQVALDAENSAPNFDNLLEVPVWKVTGLSGALTPGVRVDALFLAGGESGAPASPRQLLFALRNVEVISSEAPSDSGRGSFPPRTTLRVTAEQLRETRDLPPAIVEIVVSGAPKRLGKAPAESGAPAQHRIAKRSYVSAPFNERAAAGISAAQVRVYSAPSSATRLRWQFIIWGTLTYLVAACCMQAWRRPRRALRQNSKRGNRRSPLH